MKKPTIQVKAFYGQPDERTLTSIQYFNFSICRQHNKAEKLATYSFWLPATGAFDFLMAYVHPSSLWIHLYTLPNSPSPSLQTSWNSSLYLDVLISWRAIFCKKKIIIINVHLNWHDIFQIQVHTETVQKCFAVTKIPRPYLLCLFPINWPHLLALGRYERNLFFLISSKFCKKPWSKKIKNEMEV